MKGQLILAFVVTLFGCGLIGVSMWIPPAGVIDPTVLTALGEILTFAGALVGIDYRYNSNKGDKGEAR